MNRVRAILFYYHCPPDKLTGLTGLGILSVRIKEQNYRIKKETLNNET